MTLNITKKKIEKVLELFNHPQTRKIRKNRGKKRRRNNKSFNRKNGRKNLATSTLKKKGGHAGHPILNGGQVGVVLGGQVGGDMKANLQAFVEKYKKRIGDKYQELINNSEDNDTNREKFWRIFFRNLIKNIKNEPQNNKNENYTVSPLHLNDKFLDLMKENENENDSDSNSDSNSERSVEDLLNLDFEGEENELSPEEKNIFKDLFFPEENKILSPLDDVTLLGNINSDTTEVGVGTDNTGDTDNTDNTGDTKDQSNTKESDQQDQITKTVETNPKTEQKVESKEIDTSEMLKVALASNYFTQYGILSGMLKMNQEKDNDKFDVMDFVQDPKLYAEFCNKMGFQFAEMKEEPVVENKTLEENQEVNQKVNSDVNQKVNSDANSDAD